jgi:hypothetical protein
LYELILLYLQFRWLPMERNIIYTRWNVSFTTRVMEATRMLQVRSELKCVWRDYVEHLLLMQLSRLSISVW